VSFKILCEDYSGMRRSRDEALHSGMRRVQTALNISAATRTTSASMWAYLCLPFDFTMGRISAQRFPQDRSILNMYRRNLDWRLQSLTKILFPLFNRFYRYLLPSCPPFYSALNCPIIRLYISGLPSPCQNHMLRPVRKTAEAHP
jgi:hypothetical protein